MTQQISIYIPFYKGLTFLKEAVESVLAQSNPNWTLVIMDDCGPDGAVANAWISALNDKRISYHRHSKNLGMVGNWNTCLDDAVKRIETGSQTLTGNPLVTLLHDDDRLLPNYVELMVSESHSHPEAALYFCGASVINEMGRRVFSLPDVVKKFIAPADTSYVLQGEKAFERLLAGCFIMCPTVCYNMKLIESFRFSRGLKQVQDLEFYLNLLSQNLVLKGTATKAYEYRRHPTNATSLQTKSLLRFEEEVELYNTWATRLREKGFVRAAAVAQKKRIILLNLIYCVFRDAAVLDFKSILVKLNFLKSRVLFSRTALATEERQA